MRPVSLNSASIGAWLILAPIGAAFLASFALALGFWLIGLGEPGAAAWTFHPSPLSVIGVTFLYGLASSIIALVANATMGLFWQLVAYRWRVRALPAHLIAGVCAGVAVAVVFLWDVIQFSPTPSVDLALLLSFGGVIGGLTALFAWLIRRPDRDAPNPPTSAP